MMNFLKEGRVGNIELDSQQRIRREISERWDRLGFTEGLEGHVKDNVATLFENQAKHLLREATASDNSGSFETVVFPIIRRVFSKLLANDIVSVQAMNLPIGKMFFILPVTSEREKITDATGEVQYSHAGSMGAELKNRNTGKDEIKYYVDGVTSATTRIAKFMDKTLYDLYYDDFLFDNSKGNIRIKVGTATPAALVDNKWEAMTNVSQLTVNGSTDTVDSMILEVSGFASYNPGRLTGPDGNEMDTEAFLASLKIVANSDITVIGGTSGFAKEESINFRVVTQKYGRGIIDRESTIDAEGKLYIEVDLTKPAEGNIKTSTGYIGVAPTSLRGEEIKDGETGTGEYLIKDDLFLVTWCQYDSLELETEMGEVSFKIESVTVSVEERKLRATWSPELAQDVSAFHNIDAEAELTSILSEQIGAEMDREILRDLRKSAPWTLRWDYNGWKKLDGYSTNYTQKDWNQELMVCVNQISAQIHKATLRGGANFIVVSSEISAVLDNLEYFHVSDASPESDQYNMGIEKVGQLSGRYTVYRDPYSPANSMIIGHKGKSLLDTGYIYAPYVPMQLTPTMYNPFNFAPVKGIQTRYAKKMVNGRYYGHIRVDGLKTWSTSELR